MQLSHNIEVSLPGATSLQDGLDDAQLVQASQRGDQDAFAVLMQRHQRRVFNMILRMLQDYEEANEITQEAFLAAWKGLSAFRGEALFSTWLYRIAYNCCLRQLEKREQQRTLQVAMRTEQAMQRVNEENLAEEMIELHDWQIAVRKQLEKLPTRYRLVLILRHLQEMTYEEMAEVLAIPVGTIKTHLFRARHLLKERLLAQHIYSAESRELS
ncbi:MAG: sigma-70 family RNA polymerase sigma factor [Chloroflexota bacterium]|nr:sigma-70 family RNA polymerase sigma factor [Chloroflexota bacterium]